MNFDEHPDLYKPLILNSDYDSIISILDAKPILKVVIHEYINNILDFNNYKKYEEFYKLTIFINYFIKMNNFEIIKKIIIILNDFYTGYYMRLLQLFVGCHKLDKYFEMMPFKADDKYANNLYHELIKYNLINDEITCFNADEIKYCRSEIIKYAVKNKNIPLLRQFLHDCLSDVFTQDSYESEHTVVDAFLIITKIDLEISNYDFNSNYIMLCCRLGRFDEYLNILPVKL
jgi:hypothetical protein